MFASATQLQWSQVPVEEASVYHLDHKLVGLINAKIQQLPQMPVRKKYLAPSKPILSHVSHLPWITHREGFIFKQD